jgi:hypothetical protein
MLTEENLGDIGARLERSPRKSLAKLSHQADVSVSLERTATKALKLRPKKITSALIAITRPSYKGTFL